MVLQNKITKIGRWRLVLRSIEILRGLSDGHKEIESVSYLVDKVILATLEYLLPAKFSNVLTTMLKKRKMFPISMTNFLPDSRSLLFKVESLNGTTNWLCFAWCISDFKIMLEKAEL